MRGSAQASRTESAKRPLIRESIRSRSVVGTLYLVPVIITTGAGILALLLAPVSLRFDSRENQLMIRWLGFSLTKKQLRGKPRKPEEKVGRRGWVARTMRRLLLEDKTFTLKMVHRLFRPAVSVIRSVSVSDMEGTFSVPNPLWNGLLHGVLANVRIKNTRLSMNFEHVNYVKGYLRFYPYKVLRETPGLLIRLPYGRIIRILLSHREVS